jgi:hypothetical protein
VLVLPLVEDLVVIRTCRRGLPSVRSSACCDLGEVRLPVFWALAISSSISASKSPQVVCVTFVLSALLSSGSMSVATLLTATTIRPD